MPNYKRISGGGVLGKKKQGGANVKNFQNFAAFNYPSKLKFSSKPQTIFPGPAMPAFFPALFFLAFFHLGVQIIRANSFTKFFFTLVTPAAKINYKKSYELTESKRKFF